MKILAIKLAASGLGIATLAGIQLISLSENYDPQGRFNGGSFDGSTSVQFIQNPPISYLPSARYSGSAYDGASTVSLVQGQEPNPSPRFSGNPYDGFAHVAFLQNQENPYQPSERFSGGYFDGSESIFISGSVFDLDNDGLPDYWELLYCSNITVIASGSDNDNDGFSSYDEFIAGTDPMDAGSLFDINMDMTEGEPPHFIIEWLAVSGRVYNVFWTPSLIEPFEPLEIGIQYPQNSYTDLVHSAESSGYYRVVVMRADQDADGDGLPNEWETRYAVSDAHADDDEDGFDNLAEYIAGTNPTNKMSYFKVSSSTMATTGDVQFVVEWISLPDRVYSIQWSTNLAEGFHSLETGLAYPQQSYTNAADAMSPQRFFKVDVRLK